MEDIGLPSRCQGSLGHVKTRYTKADPNHMAEVGPVGPDGKEIPVSLVYWQVELAAKYLSDFGFRQTLKIQTLGCARRSFPYRLVLLWLAGNLGQKEEHTRDTRFILVRATVVV